MKKLISILFVLSALIGNIFADSLMGSLNALGPKAKAVTGTIPEGRELLPVIFNYLSENTKEDTNGYCYLKSIDLDSNTYVLEQVAYAKAGKFGYQKQNSTIQLSASGNTYTVNTMKFTTQTTDNKLKATGTETEVSNSTRTKFNKIVADNFAKRFEMSDEEYKIYEDKAYTDFAVLQTVAMTSTNKLKAKMWFKNHPVEGKEVETSFTVTTVDEGKNGYAYKLQGMYYPRGLEAILVTFNTNDDSVVNYSAGDTAKIKGKISKISFSDGIGYQVSHIELTD